MIEPRSSYDGAGVGSDSWPKLGAFLGDWTSNGRSFHFSSDVDNNSSVVYIKKRGQKMELMLILPNAFTSDLVTYLQNRGNDLLFFCKLFFV